MKPTPGPYKVCYTVDEKGATLGCSVVTDDDARAVVAMFPRRDSLRTAMANAEAWIAGVAAIGKLEKIRAAYKDKTLSDELLVIGVGQILDEP